MMKQGIEWESDRFRTMQLKMKSRIQLIKKDTSFKEKIFTSNTLHDIKEHAIMNKNKNA